MTELSTVVPYKQQNLHQGHRYIKNRNMIALCPWSLNSLDLNSLYHQELTVVLDKQMGRLTCTEYGIPMYPSRGLQCDRPKPKPRDLFSNGLVKAGSYL